MEAVHESISANFSVHLWLSVEFGDELNTTDLHSAIGRQSELLPSPITRYEKTQMVSLLANAGDYSEYNERYPISVIFTSGGGGPVTAREQPRCVGHYHIQSITLWLCLPIAQRPVSREYCWPRS
jgi:hypothetical protein